jgi:hypothetical protein
MVNIISINSTEGMNMSRKINAGIDSIIIIVQVDGLISMSMLMSRAMSMSSQPYV